MRYVPSIFERVASGLFIGDNAPNGRVTVDSGWYLKSTDVNYGNSVRGPYRYYTDGNQLEHELPAVKSIEWNRSDDQDLASCKITLYNTWHEGDGEQSELSTHFGKPGYFWAKRGKGDSALTWNQSPGRGAYTRDGTWDASFSWEDVLVEDTILRTYEGFGGRPTKGNYVSIQDNIDNENVLITGVWIVNSVSTDDKGLLVLDCVDIGRLLLDQIVFPPIVPGALYPLEYYPPGKSAFDSPWGVQLGTKEGPGSRGEVRSTAGSYSGSGDSTIGTNTNAMAVDGNWTTFALSDAYDRPDGDTVWFEYNLGQGIDALELRPWAGGYTCYISVMEDGTWQGSESIPGGGIAYVKKLHVPLAVPDNHEQPLQVDFRPDSTLEDIVMKREFAPTYDASKVRISFQHLYPSSIPNSSGDRYRAGIRSLIFYRKSYKVDERTADFSTLWWTYAMEQHPTRGYWVLDSSGNVYGYGDASDYDSTGFGTVPLATVGGANNRARAIAAHPDGKGYWVVDWMGHVFAYGSADFHGEYPIPDPYLPFEYWDDNSVANTEVWDIAATHTGNGYWVCYGDGVIRGFGDASPSYIEVPNTDVADFMTALNGAKYSENMRATAIASHPHAMGLWVTSGSGEVWAYGACINRGALQNRVYAAGMSGSFRLNTVEWATSIESTATGNGYWISFGSGYLAAFGDALDQGPVDVYEDIRGSDEVNIVADQTSVDWGFFRALVWSVARDPDGSGFWVLNAGGDVLHHNADFWSQKGTDGTIGYRWHDGNFDGDWASIVKDLLMWAGFLYYDPDIASDEAPSVLGLIESTGINTDTMISGDRFDKKTLMDVIKELTQVVGYRFRITEEGGAHYASPNWWRAGNFDASGTPIWVNSIGERVGPEDLDAGPFIPVVHESVDLLSHSVTLSSTDKRSEIIIGTEQPDAKDPSRTSYVRHYPPQAWETLANGVPSMRGIQRPAMWISEFFENEEERQLMAELIGIHSWFATRTAASSIVANPCLSIGDQIRFVEQNTSETFIHLIRSINSKMDLETGSYTMDISSHWLGSADNWVITTTPGDNEYPYIVISERLNSWQSLTNRGLDWSSSTDGDIVFTLSGEFSGSVISMDDGSWEFEGYITTAGRLRNFTVTTDILSPPLGSTIMMSVYDESDNLIANQQLGTETRSVTFANPIGVDGERVALRYVVSGVTATSGNGRLKLSMTGDNAITNSVTDSVVITRGADA